MSINIIERNVNMTTYPSNNPDPTDKVLTIGDLHGNVMKGIYFLITSGVMQLKNQQPDLKRLWEIYRTDVDKVTQNTLKAFQRILDSATIKQPKLITFIGDELADRGRNDYYTLLLMQKLHDTNTPYQIMLSNHSRVALESFDQGGVVHGMSRGRDGGQNQQRSLDNMWTLCDKKIIEKEHIITLANKVYKPHLRLIGYTLITHNDLTLYTHAPVGINEIIRVYNSIFLPPTLRLDLFKNNNSADSIIQCINAINKRISEKIMLGQFSSLHNMGSENDPIGTILWNRDIILVDESTTRFSLNVIFGHIGESPGLLIKNTEKYKAINLDTDIGRPGDAQDPDLETSGKLIYSCVTVNDNKKLTSNYDTSPKVEKKWYIIRLIISFLQLFGFYKNTSDSGQERGSSQTPNNSTNVNKKEDDSTTIIIKHIPQTTAPENIADNDMSTQNSACTDYSLQNKEKPTKVEETEDLTNPSSNENITP